MRDSTCAESIAARRRLPMWPAKANLGVSAQDPTMDIAHLAQREQVILYAESSVVAAVDLMQRNHVECAPVVDEAGRLVGELRLPLSVDAMRKASKPRLST